MKWFTIFFVVWLLASFFIILAIYNFMRSEGYQCTQNPLSYGSQKLDQQNNGITACSCSLNKPNSPILRFNANKTWIEVIGGSSEGSFVNQEKFKDINFSGFKS